MIVDIPELKVDWDDVNLELNAASHHHPATHSGPFSICPGCVHVGDHALRANLIENYHASLGNGGIPGRQGPAQYINPQELTCIKPEPTSTVSDEEWVVVKGDETETEHTILVSEISLSMSLFHRLRLTGEGSPTGKCAPSYRTAVHDGGAAAALMGLERPASASLQWQKYSARLPVSGDSPRRHHQGSCAGGD